MKGYSYHICGICIPQGMCSLCKKYVEKGKQYTIIEDKQKLGLGLKGDTSGINPCLLYVSRQFAKKGRVGRQIFNAYQAGAQAIKF